MTHLDELLSVYLDGEATRAEVQRIESHLSECHRCRRRLEHINEARAAVRSLPLVEFPVQLPTEVPAPAHRRRSVWLGAAAAIAAAVVAVATVLTPPQEPLDLSQVSLQLGARSSLESGSASFKVVVPQQVEGVE